MRCLYCTHCGNRRFVKRKEEDMDKVGVNMERIKFLTDLGRAYKFILENDFLSLTEETKLELRRRDRKIKSYLRRLLAGKEEDDV